LTNLKLEKLYTYPIKSCKGIALTATKVQKIGFEYDRSFAVININNQILTARENQQLLSICPEIQNKTMTLTTSQQAPIAIDLTKTAENKIEVGIFKDVAHAYLVDAETDAWLSEVLQEKCRLVMIDNTQLRNIKAKYNGQENDVISFSDIAPIHVLSEASMADLNTKLENTVTFNNFRPNIVVSGCAAYEEDDWKYVTIGDCEFEVILKTPRCTFTTINPITTIVDAKQEPLRTLSRYRKAQNSVDFGIYLKPTKVGAISINQPIKTR